MASELIVQTLKGPTSGANANKVIIPSGQTLELNEGVALPSGTTLPAGVGGKVLQVVSMTSTSENSTGSTSYVATSLTQSITPSSTSSKIYASFSSAAFCNTNGFIALTLYRGDSTNLGTGTYGLTWAKDYTTNFIDSVSFQYLDSPSTTSAVTYTVRIRAQESGHSVTLNINGTRGVLTLMEIAG